MPSSKPLAGHCVIEIGHSVAAPYTALILGELGAEVIKVESPGKGDYARGWGPPFHEGAGPHFRALNRGKRSVVVDLTADDQCNALKQLILERADAVICNLRPGAAAKRGLAAAQLLALKPALLYCDIGAFGSTGPMADKPGYDPLMQAYGGLMSITGEDETRPPIRVGVSMIDMGAGLWGAIGILSGLLERKTTGKGGLIETSLFETALAWNTIPIGNVLMAHRVLRPNGSGAEGIVPYQAFLTQDGWLVVGAGNDRLFKTFVTAIGMPGLAEDPRYATNGDRVTNRKLLLPVIEAEMATRRMADLRSLLDGVGVPNAPVQRIDQVIEDPQTIAVEMIQRDPGGAPPTVGLPLKFDGVRPGYRHRAPRLGEHSQDVFGKAPARD